MRSVLLLLFCGLVAGAFSSTSGCSGDDSASTVNVGDTTSSGGDGGNMCPTDTCGAACGAGESCCNGACVDLNSDIFNCGQCCKSCPNPHPVCALDANGVAQCGHAACNKPTNDCTQTEFCCDQVCCAEGMLCCPNGDGTYGCGTPDAAGKCP